MSFWPVPDLMKKDIYEIQPEELLGRGIRFVLLDVDNTLAPYTVNEPEKRLKEWARGLREAGLELFILSNNRGSRPEIFAGALGTGFVGKARKPFTAVAKKVLHEHGAVPEQTALVGDQIYTDTLCAKRLGVMAVLVEPIKFTNIFLRVRYWLEAPFRLAGRIQVIRYGGEEK